MTDQDGFYFVGVDANRAGEGRWVPVEAVVDHPRYSDSRAVNDIALLRPLVRLNLRSYARLGTSALSDRLRSSRPPALRIYGWGLDQNSRPSKYLRFANLKVQTKAATRAFGSNFRPELMLAAGQYHPVSRTYAGACNGDSGGPLIVTVNRVSTLVGVTSYGKRGCDVKAPTVFTSIGDFRAWISSARSRLPREAVSDNRAIPVSLSAPMVTGSASLGSALTCASGQWTSNAGPLTYGWIYNGSSTVLHLGQQHVIAAADAGKALVCAVLAESAAGSALSTSSPVPLVTAPLTSGSPTLGGLPTASALPSPGTVATCNAPAYSQPGLTYSYSWSAGLTGGTALGEGPSLSLSEQTLRTIAGNYLVCTVRASNAMGTHITEVRRYTTTTSAPVIFLSLSPTSVSAGTVVTCNVSNYGGTATSLTYRWGIQSIYPSGALSSTAVLLPGTSGSYSVTAGDMANLSGGKYLTCEATASSWQGSDTDARGILVF